MIFLGFHTIKHFLSIIDIYPDTDVKLTSGVFQLFPFGTFVFCASFYEFGHIWSIIVARYSVNNCNNNGLINVSSRSR